MNDFSIMDYVRAYTNKRWEYRITWFIENYSYCWHRNGEKLTSPEFTADGLNGTKWCLQVYPRGQSSKSSSNVSIYLARCPIDNGPEIMPLRYVLSVLASDGSAIKSKEIEYSFKKGIDFGDSNFVEMDEVFLRGKSEFLYQDRFCVHCVIWRGEGNVDSITEFDAVTRIGIKHMSFIHIVEGFSSFKPNKKKTIQIKSPSGHEFLSSSVYYSEGFGSKGKITVEIIPNSPNHTLTICKLSILADSRKLIESCRIDNRFNCIRKDIQNMSLSLTRAAIVNKKNKYFVDDNFSLLCDCTFSTGIEFQKIENTLHQVPRVALNLISNNRNEDANYTIGKLSACPSALDDLKAIYNDLFLPDIELKTKTKSFPAHKIVLCARSPVFKAMLTSDMKEKIMKVIQVDDLEDDTIQLLLLFLYSDVLENLRWDSAINLYYAGDKYNIEKLKVLCSSFLLDKLRTSNVVELLLLADKHNDSDLRKFTENFILEHEEEVFSSDEWEKLMKINLQLFSRTMHLKYKRIKEGK